MWIFFTGYGKCGKDTSANYLVENYGYDKLAFADGVRAKAEEENRFLLEIDMTYKEIAALVGYENAKENQCVRDYLVEIGHGCREKYGKRVWIDMLDDIANARVPGGRSLPLTVPDCRYLNEELYGRERGKFVLIRIKRKECKAKHVTEKRSIKELNPDYIIRNDGTIEELLKKVELIYSLESNKYK
jgi:dephospho-CoA kinase